MEVAWLLDTLCLPQSLHAPYLLHLLYPQGTRVEVAWLLDTNMAESGPSSSNASSPSVGQTAAPPRVVWWAAVVTAAGETMAEPLFTSK